MPFSDRVHALIGASKIPPHGWTATKMDAQYRQRFSAPDKWWLALQFGSASDAFKSIPEILAVKDGGGNFFIPATSWRQASGSAVGAGKKKKKQRPNKKPALQ